VPTKLARFTVNIPEQLAKSVEDLARQDQRSVSKYLALVIQEHVDRAASQPSKSEEGPDPSNG
jgi:metal-responsive CopG/Arc/MetJ family transcriptional regulator